MIPRDFITEWRARAPWTQDLQVEQDLRGGGSWPAAAVSCPSEPRGVRFSTMSRADVVQRIESLTDEAFDRIAPYLEADLDAADEMPDLRAEIERGLESARTEPLLDHEAVMAMGRARLRAS